MRAIHLARAAVTVTLLFQAASAVASDDTVSSFADKEQHVLGIGAVLHWKDMHDAAMLYIGNSKADQDGLLIHFHDQAEWRKFVAYWEQTKATPPPGHGWVDVGTMEDANGIGLIFTKYASGAVGFELGDDHLNTRDFKLEVSLFGTFDSKLKAISETIAH